MSLVALPVELYGLIVSDACLDRRDLYSLCLSSRVLSAESYPSLYHTIALCDSHDLDKCLRSIYENPQLARHVRSFAVYIKHWNSYLYSFVPWIIDAVSNMTKLNYFCVSNPMVRLDEAGNVSPRTLWTKRLNLPPIEHLRLSFTVDHTVAEPLSAYFGQLSGTPRVFTCMEEVHRNAIDSGVVHLTCRSLVLDSIDIGPSLPSLRTLVTERLPVSQGIGWAPNLESLHLVFWPVPWWSRTWMEWKTCLGEMPSIKQLGFVSCLDLSEGLYEAFTNLQHLEVLALAFFDIKDSEAFGIAHIKQLSRTCPGLRHIVVSDRRLDWITALRPIKHWRRDMRNESTSTEERDGWVVSSEQVRDLNEVARLAILS